MERKKKNEEKFVCGNSRGSAGDRICGGRRRSQRFRLKRAGEGPMEVKIDNFSFAPATLTLAAGTTVTWTNRDDTPHTVVSTDDPKTFKSKVLDTDEKFSFTFSKPGTFAYFCSIHPKMTGKVIVQ
jgi:plastocyanin